MSRWILPLICCLLSTAQVHAGIVLTSFSESDGFGLDGSPVSLTSQDGSLTATFTGGIARTGFDFPSHNTGRDAYYIINGDFLGSSGQLQSGSTDVGTITFNRGVESVSFFAADRASGTPALRIRSISGDILASRQISFTSNSDGTGARPFEFESTDFGQLIGSIEFDNAGPANNPPYVIAIDTFRASSSAVPEPSGLACLVALGASLALRRRRS
ncbi:MAG: PEP-CTERM sorting domain-containing protein [Aureliella sp.]